MKSSFNEDEYMVWVVIISSKHSLLKEVDSVHASEESALMAADELYETASGFEVLVEPFHLENLENG